jgi:hypothetical protein
VKMLLTLLPEPVHIGMFQNILHLILETKVWLHTLYGGWYGLSVLLQLEGYVHFSFDFLMLQLIWTVPILTFTGWNKLLWPVSESCTTCAQLGGAMAEGWPRATSANGDRLLRGRLCDGDKLWAAKVCIILNYTMVNLGIS